MKPNKIVAIFAVIVLVGFAVATAQQPPTSSKPDNSTQQAVVGQSKEHQERPPSTEHTTLNLLFNGMTAIGTLGISLLAIFGPRIRSWVIRPILNFRVDSEASPLVEQLDRDDETSSSGKKKYYEIRVEIANSGRDAARNCRARVNAIYKQRPGTSDFFAAREFVPRYLYWAKKDTKSEESLDILPRLPEYVVVGRLTEQEDPTTGGASSAPQPTKPVFGLEVSVEPDGVKGKFCFFGEGKIVLPFLVYADNLRSYEQKYVEMFWDGKSIADYGAQHFTVKLLAKKEGDSLVKGANK